MALIGPTWGANFPGIIGLLPRTNKFTISKGWQADQSHFWRKSRFISSWETTRKLTLRRNTRLHVCIWKGTHFINRVRAEGDYAIKNVIKLSTATAATAQSRFHKTSTYTYSGFIFQQAISSVLGDSERYLVTQLRLCGSQYTNFLNHEWVILFKVQTATNIRFSRVVLSSWCHVN